MMYEESEENARYTYMETQPIYTSHVLTGNWFQTRYDNIPLNNTAIVPCVLESEQKGCERHLTTNQEVYSREEFMPNELTREYHGGKLSQYYNYKLNTVTNKPVDAEKYIKNCTSLNHLVFELFPKMLQQDSGRADDKVLEEDDALKRHLRTTQLDPLEPYGDRPKRRRPCKEPTCPPPTTYRRQFTGRHAPAAQSAKMEDMIKIVGRFD